MTTIELVVLPAGETRLETKGVAGRGCREASPFLKAALGVKASGRPTPEAYLAAAESSARQPH